MIHVAPVPEPGGFDARARKPGAVWLAKHPNATRPKDLWGPFKGNLAAGFGNLCAYSALFEPVGTVDHFVSCDEDRSQAYQWANYRYASAWLNSSKGNLKAAEILDPFKVKDGWFRILLPSLQLVVDAERIPPDLLARAEFMLTRLHLRDDERVLRQRHAWLRLYEAGDLTLEGLRKVAPLIARAI